MSHLKPSFNTTKSPPSSIGFRKSTIKVSALNNNKILHTNNINEIPLNNINNNINNNNIHNDSKLDKLERKLRISIQECYSYRNRLEYIINKNETLENDILKYKNYITELEEKLLLSQNGNGKNSNIFKPSYSMKSVAYNNDNNSYKISLRASNYWNLIRESVKLSFVYKNLMNDYMDEKSFLALLARCTGLKQKLIIKEIYKLITQFKSLLKISNAMGSDFNLKTAVQRVVAATHEILGCERVALFIVDPIKNEIECKYSKDETGWRIPIGKCISGECAASGLVFNIKDCYDDPRFDQTRDNQTGFRTKSMLCMPIRDNNQNILAIVQAMNKNDGVFTKSDELLLETVAIQSGIAISRTQLYENEIKTKNRTACLLEIVKAIAQTDGHNSDDLIKTVISSTQSALNCDRVSLFIVDAVNQELVLKISADAAGFRMNINQGIVGHVATTGDYLNIIDVYEDPRFNQEIDKQTNYKTRSMLCSPVRDSRQNVLAVIQAINKYCDTCAGMNCDKHGVEFDSDDLRLINAVCSEITTIFQKKQMEIAFSKILEDPSINNGVRSYIKQYSMQARDIWENDLEENEAKSEEISSEPPIFNMKKMTLAPEDAKSISFPKTSNVSMHEILVRVEEDEEPISIIWERSLEVSQFNFSYEQFTSLEFDYFQLTNNQLFSLITVIFEEFKLISLFNINRSRLSAFIEEVERNYNKNPYHNFFHAFSTLHAMYNLCRQKEISSKLVTLDILSLFVAALCHDLQHPGVSNIYLIGSMSELAVKYNDIAVLENHHASTCFSIIKQSKFNIFSSLSKNQFREVRSTIIESILHTDMSKHNSLLTKIKDKASTGVAFAITDKGDRSLLCSTLMHSSDLSNPILSFSAYKKLSYKIFEEIYNQYKLEVEQNIPHSIKVESPSLNTMAELQINFINYVARPLWSELKNMFNNGFIFSSYERLNSNEAAFLEILCNESSKSEMIFN